MPRMSVQTIFTSQDDALADSPARVAENRANVARAMAIISHLMIVLGMVMVGYWHFDNIKA